MKEAPHPPTSANLFRYTPSPTVRKSSQHLTHYFSSWGFAAQQINTTFKRTIYRNKDSYVSLCLPYIEQVNFYGSSSFNLPVQVLFAQPLGKPAALLWALSCLFMSSLKCVAPNCRLHVSISCTWHTTLLSMLLRMTEGLYCSSSPQCFQQYWWVFNHFQSIFHSVCPMQKRKWSFISRI